MYRRIVDAKNRRDWTERFFTPRFSNDCRKTKTKVIVPTNHTGANSTMNQSEFVAITSNSLKTQQKVMCARDFVIGFGFASNWPKKWQEIFKSIS